MQVIISFEILTCSKLLSASEIKLLCAVRDLLIVELLQLAPMVIFKLLKSEFNQQIVYEPLANYFYRSSEFFCHLNYALVDLRFQS